MGQEPAEQLEPSGFNESVDNDVLIAQLEEVRAAKAKRPKAERGIVFQQPTEAEKEKDYKGDTARPLIDKFGRHRWVSDRLCWCPDDAGYKDCRFHNQNEPGWEECPNTPRNVSIEDYKIKPRRLWSTNPDFEKVPSEEEVQLLINGGCIATPTEAAVENISHSGDVQQVVEITS